MHSVSPYMLRCYNRNLSAEDKYSVLDNVAGHDIFDLLESFIADNSHNFKIIESSKQVYRFDSFTFDKSKRVIRGWLQAGTYGIKTDIINNENGAVDRKSTRLNSVTQ